MYPTAERAVSAILLALALSSCAPKPDAVSTNSPSAQTLSTHDWNGRWMPWSSKPRPAEIAFDPEHFISPPDPVGEEYAGAGLVGLIEGTYLTEIPYNDEWLKRYRNIVKDAEQGKVIDKVAVCQPYGFPRVMGGNPSGPEIVVLPEVVIMHFDVGSAIRHIYTDGRGHPSSEGFDGSINLRWNGHSIGRWEGDTLVVDTVGTFPSFYDQTAAPHSDQLHVVERIRLVEKDRLEVAMVIEDPIAFRKPWHVTRYFVRAKEKWPDVRDSTCAPDNMIEINADGYQDLVLPAEREAQQQAEDLEEKK
jgi:hypothetical protein